MQEKDGQKNFSEIGIVDLIKTYLSNKGKFTKEEKKLFNELEFRISESEENHILTSHPFQDAFFRYYINLFSLLEGSDERHKALVNLFESHISSSYIFSGFSGKRIFKSWRENKDSFRNDISHFEEQIKLVNYPSNGSQKKLTSTQKNNITTFSILWLYYNGHINYENIFSSIEKIILKEKSKSQRHSEKNQLISLIDSFVTSRKKKFLKEIFHKYELDINLEKKNFNGVKEELLLLRQENGQLNNDLKKFISNEEMLENKIAQTDKKLEELVSELNTLRDTSSQKIAFHIGESKSLQSDFVFFYQRQTLKSFRYYVKSL